MRQDIQLRCVLAKEMDGAEAIVVEQVVDISCEVAADGFGCDGDAWTPLLDEIFDVGEAVVAGELEILRELGGCEAAGRKGFGAYRPDGRDPGESGVLPP